MTAPPPPARPVLWLPAWAGQACTLPDPIRPGNQELRHCQQQPCSEGPCTVQVSLAASLSDCRLQVGEGGCLWGPEWEQGRRDPHHVTLSAHF